MNNRIIAIVSVFFMILTPSKAQQTCIFPCWMGMTPGKTTKEEVFSFINNYILNNTLDYNIIEDEEEGLITISWRTILNGYTNVVALKNDILYRMTFSTSGGTNLIDALFKYGEPKGVSVASPSSMDTKASVAMYYPEQGLTCGLEAEFLFKNFDRRRVFIISPYSSITSITLEESTNDLFSFVGLNKDLFDGVIYKGWPGINSLILEPRNSYEARYSASLFMPFNP